MIAGLVLGGVYALATAALITTYVTAGVLNLAFGSLAFFVARLYYYLHTQSGWGIAPAAVVSILLVGPGLGILLWAVLFRTLSGATSLVKVVVTVGLSVAIPPIAVMLFGDLPETTAPGLAPQPVHIFHIAGVVITADQMITFLCVTLIVALGALVFRYTEFGLVVRAVVDSSTMTSLVGVNPQAVAAAVWAVSVFLAGLSGVLMAPLISLQPENFTLLMVAAFAAVLVAKFRYVGRGVLMALLIGVVGSEAQYFLPSNSTLAQDIIPAIPFVFILVFLIFASRSGTKQEDQAAASTLGRTFALNHPARILFQLNSDRAQRAKSLVSAHSGGFVVVCAVFVLPLVLQGVWLSSVGEGAALAIVFLSYTLLAGEAGIISLCQISLAGIGAITAAQLATNHGWPVLAAIVAGGLIVMPIGALIGLLTLRMGDLYVALVTLAFGLLVDNLIFSLNVFAQYGSGVPIARPSFAVGDRAFSYLALIVFALLALLVINYRRSTAGLMTTAVRWSESGSRTIGLSVVKPKLLAIVIAAFIAGIGGSILAIYSQSSVPTNFATLTGLIWVAVLVATGVNTPTGALIAGLSFALLPALFLQYLPPSLSNVPQAMFGLGAIGIARQPDGFVAENARHLRALVWKVRVHKSIQDLESDLSTDVECSAVVEGEIGDVVA
jgi:branched-chain amino acid transport system permease protein